MRPRPHNRLLPLACALLALWSCACAPAIRAAGGAPSIAAATPQAVPVQVVVTSAPSAPPLPAASPSPAAALRYDPLRLPAYAEEFLGPASLAGYRALVEAIGAGAPSAALPEGADYARIERTLNALYPQKMLLYDARYTAGEGPLRYDAATRTVSIRYAYDADTHRALMQAFAARMDEALSACTPGMTQRAQAEALYCFVVGHLHYELDMRLTVYDAVTTGAAYCQTYAGLYQLLLVQAGIENYLTAGRVDTDGDGMPDGDHQWNRLVLDGVSCYADPTWERGDLTCFGMTYEQCVATGRLPPFLDPSDALLDGA